MNFNPGSTSMTPHLQAIEGQATASGADRTAEPASARRLVLAALRSASLGLSSAPFLERRARREIDELRPTSERAVMARLLDLHADGRTPRRRTAEALLRWAGLLESRGLADGAGAVLDLARALCPDDAELALHAARLARKSGDASTARDLYGTARRLDGASGRLARMAEVGLALLSPDPEGALGRILRLALENGQREAAAAAQEARAAVRRRKGDLHGALRDYGIAAARFRDPADRGRLGHAAADLLVAAGEPLAARRVLLEVEGLCRPPQARRARARLRELARSLGDDVGLRRWRDASAGDLVSLSPSRRRSRTPTGGKSTGPTAERIDRWIDRLRRLGAPEAGTPERVLRIDASGAGSHGG